MPFRRTRRSRPRRRRRRGRRMMRRRRRLSVIDPELKNDDQALGNAQPFVNNPAAVLMNGIQLGTNENQRIGRQIKIITFGYRLTINLPSDGAATRQTRIMLLQDKQPNGLFPLEAQLL